MGFYTRILVVLIFSFLYFAAPALAEEDEIYLSIPDFPIYRITPEKPPVVPEINKIKEKETVSTKTAIKKEPPKLRPVYQPEQTPNAKPAKTTKVSNPEKNEKLATKENKEKPKVISKSLSRPIENKKNEEKEFKKEVLMQTAQKEPSKDEMLAKINKINEMSQTSSKTAQQDKKFEDTGSDFARTFSGLGVVLLLIFVFAWVYAKVKGINPSAILMGKFGEKDLNKFNVISTSTLGQGKDIHLVEINGKQLVIGSTANNINLLTEISPDEVENLKNQTEKETDFEENQVEISEEPFDEPIEEEFIDQDYYASQYAEVYKEYVESEDSEEKPEN